MSGKLKFAAAALLAAVTVSGMATSANAFTPRSHPCDATQWWPCSADQQVVVTRKARRVVIHLPPPPTDRPVPRIYQAHDYSDPLLNAGGGGGGGGR
jgi:hypothetical protein